MHVPVPTENIFYTGTYGIFILQTFFTTKPFVLRNYKTTTRKFEKELLAVFQQFINK